MSKYFLHGGALANETTANMHFFDTITESLPHYGVVLCCYFARDKELWLELFANDILRFCAGAPDKDLQFICADESESILTLQILSADLIYLYGGSTDKLKAILGQVNDLALALQDKIVVAESAGANVLSKFYYSSSQKKIAEGLGILNLKIFCHYNDVDDADFCALNRLKEKERKINTVEIEEEEFKTIITI